MASYNKIIMMGNLTRDPELTYLPSQTPVVEFGLATNRRWTGQSGEQRDETCFVDCRAFGRMAENINKYCGKGRPLLIEGRLTFDQWEAPDGTKRSKHRVTVERFTFVDSRGSSEGAPNGAAAAGRPAEAPTTNAPAANSAGGDDIPF